ncbi:Hypothetical protein FKW44_007216 [Caligus rogercresseyi]|uniref:Uncharacterized protein n=1 Tax=Caligus rogercresseyi TaxID=217165 RepID=A0A7T8QTE9_CALRO|nr:Hypothetical protein FKW44_007216 [Caligus rogercresseyi]
MARAARVRANMVVRLAKHIPRGPYLHQLAKGIVLGKVAMLSQRSHPYGLETVNPQDHLQCPGCSK